MIGYGWVGEPCMKVNVEETGTRNLTKPSSKPTLGT